MNTSFPRFSKFRVRLSAALICATVFVCACSGGSSSESDTDTGDTGTTINDDVVAGEGAGTPDVSNDGQDEETLEDVTPTDTSVDGNNGETVSDPAETTDDTIVEASEPASPDGVPDPLVQNETQMQFSITVPAVMSDALQLRLQWHDQDIMANWVGDESWTASAVFPTDTQSLLLVTFSDNNGEVVLGTFEVDLRTGTNAAQSFEISADQFDTDRWDSDNDGVSNIDEVIAGTDTVVPAAPLVLLFSETRDFRHDSTEDAVVALEQIAASAGMETDRANDSTGVFTDENLANYDAVVWVQTSGDVLNFEEQAAFERYIRANGGYAGIHAASFTEFDWPWYGELVGAYFASHPEIQVATQDVENRSHVSTAHLGATWTRTDEWYDYRSNPRSAVNVLLSLDESSYSGAAMGGDHPSAWFHDFDGGRSWYTGGGHTSESYQEPDFRAHLLGGLRYAAGLAE